MVKEAIGEIFQLVCLLCVLDSSHGKKCSNELITMWGGLVHTPEVHHMKKEVQNLSQPQADDIYWPSDANSKESWTACQIEQIQYNFQESKSWRFLSDQSLVFMRFVVLDHLKIFRVLFELVASKLNIHKQNYQVITTYYIWKSINFFFFSIIWIIIHGIIHRTN